jgi:hypothetical protein
MDTPIPAAAAPATETVVLNATGTATPLPTAAAQALIADNLASLQPATTARVWVKLLRPIANVGRDGKVVQATPARVQPWIDAGDAAPATDAEVSMSAPAHIILED